MGAGKTNLLSIVARLQDATSGSVRLDDVDLRTIEPTGLLQVWVTGSVTRPGGPVWS
ncbi:hypothetical protein ACFC09_44035 [Streptomyces sp. NPDC056161]|uniref:hypothetical protein n=1 Tax=Streptomyces sp. NPDC056161 TaxID=3345732 RepID=UPI0035D9236A